MVCEDDLRFRDTFLSLHASRAAPTDDPCAYLGFCRDRVMPPPASNPLVRLTLDDVDSAIRDGEFDPSSELVLWLRQQLLTYDCTTQRIVGVVLDPKTVLTEVLRVSVGKRGP